MGLFRRERARTGGKPDHGVADFEPKQHPPRALAARSTRESSFQYGRCCARRQDGAYRRVALYRGLQGESTNPRSISKLVRFRPRHAQQRSKDDC
jgi:hypothetical protein